MGGAHKRSAVGGMREAKASGGEQPGARRRKDTKKEDDLKSLDFLVTLIYYCYAELLRHGAFGNGAAVSKTHETKSSDVATECHILVVNNCSVAGIVAETAEELCGCD